MTQNVNSKTPRWDLSPLFSDWDVWHKALKAFPEVKTIEAILQKYQGQFPIKLDECLKYQESLYREMDKLYMFAHLKYCENTGDSRSLEAVGMIDFKHGELQSLFSFLLPEILKTSDSDWTQWLQENEKYKAFINDILRQRNHILSDKEEKILSQISPVMHSFGQIHSQWENADLKFKDVADSEGNLHPLSHSSYSSYLQSPDTELRKNAFLEYFKTTIPWKHTVASNYSSSLLGAHQIARIRGFESLRQSTLWNEDIPESLYDSVLENVLLSKDLLQKSAHQKARCLGQDKLQIWDRVVPHFSSKGSMGFSFEQGIQWIHDSVAIFGSDYQKTLHQGMTKEGWCHAVCQDGKRSGAFSWGCYDSPPYLLLSWKDDLTSLFTLAHEAGHSMHSYRVNTTQSYLYHGYSIFIAEIASILNEILLTEHLLKTLKPGSDEYIQVVSQTILNFESTVFRQTLFAEFEYNASLRVGEGLTPDYLNHTFLDLHEKYYGSALELNDETKTLLSATWMIIPHFYHPFYVYQYVTSYCLAHHLYALMQKDKSPERALKLFSLGNTLSPLKSLQEIGIDFEKQAQQIFLSAQQFYGRYIDQMEAYVPTR